MNLMDSFYSMFGTTGIIALILSLFFASAAVINAWRRRKHSARQTPHSGPILMSDPHSGVPVYGNPAAPAHDPLPAPPSQPAEPEPEPEPEPENNPPIFRQLDAMGTDVEPSRGEKDDDYYWE